MFQTIVKKYFLEGNGYESSGRSKKFIEKKRSDLHLMSFRTTQNQQLSSTSNFL